MASSLSQSTSRDKGQEQAGQYWASRQWYYDTLYGYQRFRRNPAADPKVVKSGRQTVFAPRHLDLEHVPTDPAVFKALSQGCLIGGQLFRYDKIETPVRPIAWRLLEIMWTAPGRPVSISVVCQKLWGRTSPTAHNSLRLTVFRANSALREAEFPLRLIVRQNLILFCVAGVT